MSFTPIAIEGRFTKPDGSASVGTISARLSSELRSTVDESILDAGVVTGSLDGAGRIVGSNGLALVLYATDDVTTEPVGAYYTFTLTLESSDVDEFNSPVPHSPSTWGAAISALCVDSAATTVLGSAVVTLTNLVVASSMIGASVTGTNVPLGATVLSIDALANTLTLSANATATGVDSTLTIHAGCVSLVSLIGNAL